MLWMGFVFSYVAMLGLCKVMPRHARVLLRSEPSDQYRLAQRVLACLYLAVSLGLCITALGTEIGIVIWFCQLMLAGLLLVGLLAWRQRWVRTVEMMLLTSTLLLVWTGVT